MNGLILSEFVFPSTPPLSLLSLCLAVVVQTLRDFSLLLGLSWMSLLVS